MADAVHHDAVLDTTISFSLHLHKPLLSQVNKAAWNSVKNLLTMVTRDHHIIVHRFNWERLWAISPETKVTSLCWRPDGKALAVGHVDGSIAIHDVENGDVLRQQTTHDAAVEFLYRAQEGQESAGHEDDVFCYEDRTSRFFPSPPHIPPMPGTVSSFDMSGVSGHAAEGQSHANRKNVFRAVHERLNILCSGDQNGIICLGAFGVFPIGKLIIKVLAISGMNVAKPAYRLLDAAALQVSLSKDLRNMAVICSGALSVESLEIMAGAESTASGLYAISVDTSVLGDRLQVSLQASSVEELLEVVEATVIVMRKHWSEAISTFEDKDPEDSGNTQAYLMLLQLEELEFMPLSPASSPMSRLPLLHLCLTLGAVLDVGLKSGKVRAIAQVDAVPPLAVSASRGLACVFAGQRRALLYDLEEDEEGKDDDHVNME